MKRLLIAALLLTAATARAEESSYKFKITLDKGKFVFSDAVGAKWKTPTFDCGEKRCEVLMNRTATVGTRNANYATAAKDIGTLDLGFKHLDDMTIRTRCLREHGCSLEITNGKNDPFTKTLKSGQTMFIRSGSQIAFSALPAPPPPTPPSSSQNH
jgi:hypothetical protein